MVTRSPDTPAAAQALLVEGAIDLLPDWARAMHGLDRPLLIRPGLRLGIAGVGQLFRWALKPA